MAATALHPSILPLKPYHLLQTHSPNPKFPKIPPLSPLHLPKPPTISSQNPQKFQTLLFPGRGYYARGRTRGNPSSGEQEEELYVSNWPWTFSAEKLKELFGQCGTVTYFDFERDTEGKGKNYGFVTMATGEEALAVLDKFNNSEIEGRIISVEFAKKLRKKRKYFKERATEHQLYVTNLAWKVRVNHLREFFAQSMNPVSSRVIYGEKKTSRYGFVSFATEEEAEAALSAFDGKELMGRPVRLTFTEKKGDKTGNESQGEGDSDTEADTGSESQGEDNPETQAEGQQT